MHLKAEKVIPEHTRIEVVKTICDLCGYDKMHLCRGYEVDETEVTMKEGEVYPEGGDTTTTEFHICQTCFKTRLIPWMVSQGAKATFEERNW